MQNARSADSSSLVNEIQLETQGCGHGFQIRELHVLSLLDIADGSLVRDSRDFGQSVPGQPLRFSCFPDFGGNARRRLLPARARLGRNLANDLRSNSCMPRTLLVGQTAIDMSQFLTHAGPL